MAANESGPLPFTGLATNSTRMQDHYSETEDRVRRMVLAAVASTPELFDRFVLKGGLALQYAYGSPRRSHDLDFDAVEDFDREVTVAKEHLLVEVCNRLNHALRATAHGEDVAQVLVQRKRLSDEIPTIMTQVGYTAAEADVPPFDRWVEMQITLCEVVCETTVRDAGGIPVRVPVVEDILAEKLKAMAQQVDRGRTRSMDVFDIWYFTRRSDLSIDQDKVASYFRRKTAALGGATDPEVFCDDLFRAFSGNDYALLVEDLDDRCDLPSFRVAFDAVMALTEPIRLGVG